MVKLNMRMIGWMKLNAFGRILLSFLVEAGDNENLYSDKKEFAEGSPKEL
jgi:hypothetical protein